MLILNYIIKMHSDILGITYLGHSWVLSCDDCDVYRGLQRALLLSWCNCVLSAAAPVCVSSVPPGDPVVAEGETYSMRCTASYTGDPGWAPKMEWRDPNGIVYDVSDSSSPGVIDVTVERVGLPSHDGYVYTAKTLFEAYDGDLPEDTATNVPTYTFTHTFDVITVHCKLITWGW